MKDMFAQGGSGSAGIKTNKQAIARDFDVEQSQVCYAKSGQPLTGYKVIYDKVTQRAYSLPIGLTGTVVSMSADGVLTHTGGTVDLGALAASREEYVTLPGSFTTGQTLSVKNDALTHTTGRFSWAGELPKVVPANSTPEGTGGISSSAWIPVVDKRIRSDFASTSTGKGDSLLGVMQPVAGAIPRTQHDKNQELYSIYDFGGKDDYDGTNAATCTNNKAAFAAYFTYLNSIGGGDLHLPKLNTGKYFINGDDPTQLTATVRVVAEDGVSLHLIYSGGAANSPLVNVNLQANRQIVLQVVNFGFTTFLGANVQKELGESMPLVNNGDGVYTLPQALAGSDFSVVRLANLNVTEAPASTAADTITYQGNGTPAAVIHPAKLNEEVMTLISSPASNASGGTVFFAGVITANGYSYVSQNNTTQALVIKEQGAATVLSGVPYALMNQQRDMFNNAILSVKVTSAYTYSVLVNGLVVYSHRTASAISAVAFGTENANNVVYVSQFTKIIGNSFGGAKPLKIIVVGDSITDQNNQYSWAKYLQLMLGSAGISVAEINNIAVAGQTAAQQDAILRTIGSGYDLCLMLVGVNDVQGQTPISAFSTTIAGMVTYAKSIGATPIVGVPTSFYSLAEANANGQTGGQNTAHNDTIHQYRTILMRAVAASGGLLNMEPMKAYGAMSAKWLNHVPYAKADRIVIDNIHPSAYGSMMLAQGFARSILGWLVRSDTTESEAFETLPTSWLASGYGLLSVPTIRKRELAGVLSLHATSNNDGAVAFTLPPSIRNKKVKTFTVTGLGSTGLPVGVCNMYVGVDGKCYFFNLPAGTTQVSVDGIVV